MIGHLIQGKQTKPEEMTPLHESSRNEIVATQLQQKEYTASPRREVVHTCMNWTDSINDGCQIHLGEKQGSGWYPQFPRRSRKPSVAHEHDL